MKSRSLIAVARQLGLAGPEYIRKTLPRRARRERLLLAVMRYPPGEPDDLERSPDATVRIGETLGVDFRHPPQCGAFERPPAALHERIGRAHAAEIASLSAATTIIELGSGTSDKTRTLLDAFTAAGQLSRFVPVDVSEGTLRAAAMNTLNFFITGDYPTGDPRDNKCSPSQAMECRGFDADDRREPLGVGTAGCRR